MIESFEDIKDVRQFFQSMSEERIRRALSSHRREARRIASAVLDRGFRNERDAVDALFNHFNPVIVTADPDNTEPPRECNCPPANGRRWMVSPVKWYYNANKQQFNYLPFILQAINTLQSVCGIRFERVMSADEEHHIGISNEFLDGEGGTLGIAYVPVSGDDMAACGPMCGNIKIDTAENWTNGFFRTVFLHELLHAVGLPHSRDRRSIMYHLYLGIRGLHQIDIDELLRRYPRSIAA